jgi:hypothetical protein
MAEHVHVHVPQELAEHSEGQSGRDRFFEFVAVFLMAIATVGIAWSGYQAASWSGAQARSYARSNSQHERATRTASLGGQERLEDLEDFNRWLEATAKGDATVASLYERRFRPEFRKEFDAWIAQEPLSDVNAAPSPLFVDEYQPRGEARTRQLEREAEQHFELGKTATKHADDYVFNTVLLAAVLFFGGISLRFVWSRMRIVVLSIGTFFLVIGIVETVRLPVHRVGVGSASHHDEAPWR